MSGLFGVLDVASRGLMVAQQGVRNTSNNIANVNTPGYSRQRQIVVSSLPVINPNGNFGTGAEQIDVVRIADDLVQAQIVRQNSLLSSVDVQSQGLRAIEEVFNEQQGGGLGSALSAFYDAFSELAASQTPGAPVEREALRAVAGRLTDTLHAMDARLREQQASTESAIDAMIPRINELADRIASLNREISAVEGISTANELRDQRDLAIRELSGLIDIDTYTDGSAQVVLIGGGLPLVETASARTLTTVPDVSNPFDPTFSRIAIEGSGGGIDVTDRIGGGELGGLLRVRDQTLAAAIRSLDTIAYNLADAVNTQHGVGVGLDGVAGDFFAPLAGVEDAARDIALDARILASTDAIAAGLGPGIPASGDNRNAADLAELRTRALPIFLPGDPPGPATGPTRSLIDHSASVVADIGSQSAVMQSAFESEQRVGELLENRREEISGVSIDEEVTQLVQLQAAFQANARIMQAVDRLLEDVIALV